MKQDLVELHKTSASSEKTKYNMPESIPIHAHWDITNGCNFNCVFCLNSSGSPEPDELTKEQGLALIDKLYESGIFFLKILGGEPFFRRDTLDIFRYAANKGMILSFSTNASLVTKEVAEMLSQLYNSIAYVQMSLYGIDEATYKEVTGNAKNYERALKGLKLLLDKDLDVAILTVVTEKNAKQVTKYFAIAKNLGVNEFRITPEIELGRAAKQSKNGVYQTPKIWGILVKELRKIKNQMQKSKTIVKIDAKPLFGNFLFKKTGIPYFYQNCNAGTTMIYIDPTGRASPCPFLKELPTNLNKIYGHIEMEDFINRSFNEVWYSDTFRKFRDYYNPDKNLFEINTNCKFYKNGSCVPCVITPCNCVNLINLVRNGLA